MKKYILLLFIVCLQMAPAKAQWVTIPDPNFVNKLTQLFPSCMNGNQMDTTCSAIVTATQLSTGFTVSNLSGVEYFDSLVSLTCWGSQLTLIPALPGSLKNLACFDNLLTSLPPLPASLQELRCQNNLLTSLPVLPASLDYLDCSFNQLTSLPTLPNTNNFYLWCNNNLLTSLPALPTSMFGILNCSNNQLTSLPTLPNDLGDLWCFNNQLTSLPPLPAWLWTLNCNNNQLTNLPTLPNYLDELSCSNNLLTALPAIPVNMFTFIINNNNINCLEFLPTCSNANISNNPLTCVPNQTSYSLGLPLCLGNDPIGNPYNCTNVSITGYVYSDMDNNCTYSTNDVNAMNIPIKLYDNQNNLISIVYPVNGQYGFQTIPPDTFQVQIDTNTFAFSFGCGQSNMQTITLNSFSQTIQNVNFPIECSAPDFQTQVNAQGWVFPGQIHNLNTNISSNATWYNIDCGSTIYSGSVSIEVAGQVNYVAPATGALTPTVNGNTFTYNITDFNTLTPQSFGLQFLTDTTAQANDQICVHVEINPTPLDADTINNSYDFCYQVVNSYDPNMKEVYPVNVLPGYDDWFTYTIHFQNTGNAPAFNIRLRDTLDANLDINTFEINGYSHPAIVSINGNTLTVRFNNIMLPDSTTDYEGSMGYFQYRIKPLPNLPLGTQIENTAYIYFDYNAPIVTNTTQNNFQTVVSSINTTSEKQQFVLFPNPSNGIFTFNESKNIKTVEVFNMMGELVLSHGAAKQINLQAFPKGIYVARMNGTFVARLVKE